MTTPESGTAWRSFAPLALPALAGVALGVALELAEPGIRLYAAAAPGLLAGAVGLVASVVLVVGRLMRRRAAAAAEAAGRDAMVRAADDRLRFLMRLDHELKNPLTAIRAGLANIEQADAAGAAVASVSAQASRITRLVDDLRRLADLETRDIDAAPVDLAGLLQEVADAVVAIPAAADRDIQWSVPQAPWPLPVIDGDQDLLFIAVQNLLANAVKFSAPGDRVEVRAGEDDDWVLIEVADTGIGIPDDEIGEVWQELARGRAARSLPGTGIGLALVRVIVARHGGRTAIRSRDGQGTVVSIRLPVHGRTGIGTPVADPRRHRDSHGTVPA
jgi:two-component system, OmpR family, sensor kinase